MSAPPKMHAMVIRRHGGPEVLEWAEIDCPVPERDEVLVRVGACGINHLDLWTRKGERGARVEFPHALGNEAVGHVVALGPRASRWKVGDRVLVAPGFLSKFHADRSGWDARYPDYRVLGHGAPGGYAEFVKAREENLVAISDRLEMHEWAGTPLVFLTAWHMLIGRAKLRPGEKVLTMGAGSGVGSAAIQIARHFGCEVYATAGTEEKRARARELGAWRTFDHLDSDWPKALREASAGGVDVVVEHIGGDVFNQAVTTLKYGGRLVTCGATLGPDGRVNLFHLFAKQLSVLGSYMGDFDELLHVVALLNERKLRPVIDEVFPIRQAAEAHRRLEARENFGKIVLTHRNVMR